MIDSVYSEVEVRAREWRERMAKINAAWERICASRGFRA